MSGILAGLVSITSGCAVVQVWAAFLIGIIGGIVQFVMSRVRESLLDTSDSPNECTIVKNTILKSWKLLHFRTTFKTDNHAPGFPFPGL